jgi:hypothetical protein
MRNKEVKKLANLTPQAENILKVAADKWDLSARSYFRLIKVARTIRANDGIRAKVKPLLVGCKTCLNGCLNVVRGANLVNRHCVYTFLNL